MPREPSSSATLPSWDDQVAIDFDGDSVSDVAPLKAPSVPPSSLPWGARGIGAARSGSPESRALTYRNDRGASRPAEFPSAPITLPSVDVAQAPAPSFAPSRRPTAPSGRSNQKRALTPPMGWLARLRGKCGWAVPTRLASERPDSGLDTLRPYVGSRPQIHVVGEEPRPASGQRVSRIYILRGFVWGIALAATLFLVRVIHYESTASSPATPLGRSLRVLDADALASPRDPVKSLVQRASEGDKEALVQLRKKAASARTPLEVAALAEGDEVRARRHATAAVEALAKQRAFSDADRAEFYRHAGNQRTFREALLAMSKSESEAGPDLIYDVSRRFRHQKDIAGFARDLLATPPVYKYASPALTVIIDAETLTECADVRALVDRVAEEGDARAIRHMAKFGKTTGCGQHGIQDCYPCLRGDRALVDALRAAQDRRAPY